jgi:hypothetical protein
MQLVGTSDVARWNNEAGAVWLAVLLQGAVAAVTIMRARWWKVVQALIAALVTAGLATGVVVVFDLSFRTLVSTEMLAFVLGYVAETFSRGFGLALAVALAGALALWARKRAGWQEPESEMERAREVATSE